MTKAERIKAEKVKAEKTKEIKALIAGYLIRSGYSKEDLALQLNISLASLYNKMKGDRRKFCVIDKV